MHILESDPRLFAEVHGAVTVATHAASRETAVDRLGRVWRRTRASVKTILENPDSSKIFFFLCLNLAYMFVQMLWGIWTNSLGLISDCARAVRRCRADRSAIHMFFDCLALAMGLYASVMSTWQPDGTFTYGCVAVRLEPG